MNKNITPPEWDKWDPNMCIIVEDMQYYYENFTEVVDEKTKDNKLEIDNLDGRVTSLEQQIPVGPGGKGAYLNLGGTPERYPLASEMVAAENKETSFLVVARPDGIYFYNPESKQIIPPKVGGGTMAIHATFPQVHTRRETILHNTRQGLSGVYAAEVRNLELGGSWTSHPKCKVMVVVTEDGEEHQTAFHPDGIASRIFKVGQVTVPWKHIQGGGTGGGGSVDLTGIETRLDLLEAEQILQNQGLDLHQLNLVAIETEQVAQNAVLDDHENRIEAIELGGGGGTGGVVDFEKLRDVDVDMTADDLNILYLEGGKVKAGKDNPMLASPNTFMNANGSGFVPEVAGANGATVLNYSKSPVVVLTAIVVKNNTLPRMNKANTNPLENNKVREGRMTYTVNASPVPQTIRLSSSQIFQIGDQGTAAAQTIAPNTVSVYCPYFADDGAGGEIETWIFMGNTPLNGVDLSGILAEVQALKDKDDEFQVLIDGQGVRIDAIESKPDVDLTPIEDRLGVLENEPHPSFFDLTDTPTAGAPGKLIGYNMAGDSIVSYDRVSSMTDLSDTPAGLTGSATKVLTVKVDESGFEFTDFPRLGPIEARLDVLSDGHDDQETRIEILEMGGGGGSVDLTPVMNRLTDLESGHGDQEVRIETLENAPSVDLTPLEDEINILKDGHDDLEVRIDTLENKPDIDLTPIEGRLDDHNVRIDVLEAKPDVDLTPLEGQVSDLKDGHDDQEVRIEALENAPAPVGEFINLSDVEIDLATDTQSLVFVDEFGKVRANPVNPMLLHGAVPISIKSIGAKLNYVVNASASGSLFAATPYVVLDSTTTRTHTLCRFVAYDDANSTVTQGREGRTTYIFNYGNTAQNLRLGTTQRFFSTTGFESTARVIPAKTSHAYCPVILDNGGVMTECWAFMGAAPLEGIDLSGIEGAILNLQTSVADHQTRIEILEMGGGGGTVDLTPVLDRLKSVEEINTDQQLQIDTMGTAVGDMFTDHEDRIVVLENKPDVDLTPLELRLDGHDVRIDALENAPGVDFTPIELRLDGLDTTVASHDIRIDDLENAPAVDLTPLETGHAAQQVILDNHETRLDAVDVTVASHDGRIDALENAPAVDLTPLTGRLDTLETGHTSQQVILDDHGTRVDALENAPGVDLTPVLTRLTDVESVNTAQQGEIGAVDVRVTTLENKPDVDLAPLTDRVTVAEGEIIGNKGRLDVLENAPHPSFFDLTNTPSAGDPDKLIGYNLAGDAIMSYKRIKVLTDMADVPNSLVGNATKVLTVKTDQTGFEFTDYPRIAPLETRLTTLEDGHDDQETRIEALENAPPSAGASEFIALSDTPDSFVGNAGKSMIVKTDESGIEFIDSPEHGILAALEAGNLPIKWNNLKQKIAASSGNITTTNIAENAFVLGLGGNSPRYYYLPDIVDADTSPLPANSVREGRLTIVSQQGTSVRTVSLTAGCKFAINSVISTTDQSIPPGQSWILLPAIYGNGDRVWSMIGSFSSNNGYSDLYNGYTKIGSNSISSDTLFATASVTAANVVHKSFVTINATTARTIYLPPFVAFNSTTLLVSGQCRQGKVLTVGGTGGGDIHLALSAGQKFIVNGIETDTTRIMPSGIMETYVATMGGGVQKWVLINRCKGDGSPVELDTVNTTIAALEARIAALEAHHP